MAKLDRAAIGGSGPLKGIRVLDLTHMLAGPYCTWLLGSLGADVIKIEKPEGGDFARSIGPLLDDQSIYFMSVNRNKRSLTLNLKHPEARLAALRLTETADVLVENNRPDVMKRLGLDYANVASVNPRIVYASISGFGQTGPYSSRPAFDAVIQAMAGTMSITGEEGRHPVRVGTSIGDIGGGLFAALGILAALEERHRTGTGCQLDVAMLDTQLAMLENAFARYLNAGELPCATGTRHPLIAPFQVFPTASAPIVICVDTERQWKNLCDVVGKPALARDPRFVDGATRIRHQKELELALIELLKTRSATDWLERLTLAEVPAGPLNTIADIAADPHVHARQMISDTAGGKFVRQPVRWVGADDFSDRRAPSLGEHTHELLKELGCNDEEITRLKNVNAI